VSASPATQALEAARKAIAEAEAIVRYARKRYGIVGRAGPGPRTIRFRPAPAPEIEGPDYFLSDRELAEAKAACVMLAIAKLGGRAAFYRAAGGHLLRLRGDRDRGEWSEILRHECRLSIRRAYELIALARGKQTLDEARAATKARVKKFRKIKGRKR